MPKVVPISEDTVGENIDALIRHQERVKDGCELLGKRLIHAGELEFGVALISLGRIHDDSKWKGVEYVAFILGNKELLKAAIEHHRLVNPHHAAYWNGIENMPRLYLAELVCDLYARSQEFGTNLRDYLKESFFPKYKLGNNCRICRTIKEFVDMLLEKPFTALK